MSKRSVLALLAGVAVLFAAIGWFGGQQIQSPAEQAAATAAPTPSLLTVPIVLEELSQDLTLRGTARSDETSDLVVSAASGTSVVTRLTKQAGEELAEGGVAIEVSGRPVIVLEGELPAFRNFVPTLEGPDVEQLENALKRLGYDPGELDGIYDAATAAAVSKLYVAAGYKAPEISAEGKESLKQATQLVAEQTASIRTAEKAVTQAQQGPAESIKLQLDQAVEGAERALAEAENSDDTGLEAGTKADLIASAKAELVLAEATRTETLQVSDAADEKQGVTDAKAALAAAQTELNDLQTRINVEFPAAEVTFIPTLPRKVQTVEVKVGSEPEGSVMTIVGAGTAINSVVAKADRSLIEVGDTAVLDIEDLGLRFDAEITFIADSPGGADTSADRYVIRLEAEEDLPDEALGVSFRITIPVTSSGGEVLAVPLAALSAGADGTVRVEVERSEGEVEQVKVTPGLRANGLVQIDPLEEGNLKEGDRVVVGSDLVLPGQEESEDDSEDDEALASIINSPGHI